MFFFFFFSFLKKGILYTAFRLGEKTPPELAGEGGVEPCDGHPGRPMRRPRPLKALPPRWAGKARGPANGGGADGG